MRLSSVMGQVSLKAADGAGVVLHHGAVAALHEGVDFHSASPAAPTHAPQSNDAFVKL